MRTPESLHGLGERTLVLVGKTGNGKSATGNSILGRKVFDSLPSLAAVTSTCHLETSEFEDGRLVLNVIDTPGLFDPSFEPHVIAKEIASCLTLAKDGIHAVLLVLSVNRFSQEEASAFEGLCQIFGDKIADYMIVVVAHGDRLGDQSLDVFLGGAPQLLKRILQMCGNRCVLFDNMTNDEAKILQQRKELLSLVDDVIDSNGGIPYTSDLFDELKNGDWSEVEEEDAPSSEARLRRFERFIGMVECRLRESITRLEKQVEEERAAREEAEAKALEAERNSKEEMLKLAAAMEAARLEAEAKVQAAREEAEKKSKEEIDKLAARLEAEAAKVQAAELNKKEMIDLRNRLDGAKKWSRELNEQLQHRPNCAIL